MAEKAETQGTAWLAQVVNDKLGTDHTSYQLRILLRKLTKEGVIEREEGNYSFSGVRDPKVLAVLKAIKAGDLEKDKKERTTKAKATAAAKDEGEPAAKPVRTRARKKAAEPVEDEGDDDIDLDEI